MDAGAKFVGMEIFGADIQRFIAAVVKTVRTVVKPFCESPHKNEILQKHIEAQLLEMLKTFVRAEKCIKMALVEIGTSITFSDSEIKVLRDLVDVLEPVKYAVDRLCRRKATLFTAERIHDFVLKTISTSNSAYSRTLQSNL